MLWDGNKISTIWVTITTATDSVPGTLESTSSVLKSGGA